ncbi:eae-like domain protein [Escherichia coli]|uniref:eae-like domain protein n=1 Tax=Escherichia coli TaxID=562 RepID=UPI003B99D79B|nr:eae-like domain protein [Escherichia coli]MCO0350678.1 eae-like domain protein [Escherichia coli]
MESMAEGMIKDLVASGHALADDMTGAPSVLVRCLAAQLEVQLVRANELAEDHQRAIESIKQADAAVKLAHEKFSALAAENAAMHETIEAVRSVADNSSGIAGWHLNGDIATWEEILPEINDIETPATDAFLSEVRAQGVDAAIEAAKNLVAQEYEYKDFKAAQSDCCMHPGSDLVGKVEMTEWLVDFAAQLRKGGNQ